MDTVLFACVHNAGRSQMAAAWFNKMCDHTKARVITAGTQPGERIHPEVVQVMREVGIDLSGVKPHFLSEQLARQATLLVTMGCGDACPYVPGLEKLDWPLSGPKGQPIESVQTIRDEIRQRLDLRKRTGVWMANCYFAQDSSGFTRPSAASPFNSERVGMEGRRTMSDPYDKIRHDHDVAFCKEVVERIGLRFDLPSKNALDGPTIKSEPVWRWL